TVFCSFCRLCCPLRSRLFPYTTLFRSQHMEIITGAAESVPLAEASMDTVVSTLVLCSVDRIDKALSEIKRVLKPGGHFLFIEHVAAPQQSSLRRIQRWINPLWKRVADGCHTDRETWKAIKKAGFDHVD